MSTDEAASPTDADAQAATQTSQPATTPEIDTFNKSMVGVQGNYIRIGMPQAMSPREALVVAAHIVSLAEPMADMDGDKVTFAQCLEAVCNA